MLVHGFCLFQYGLIKPLSMSILLRSVRNRSLISDTFGSKEYLELRFHNSPPWSKHMVLQFDMSYLIVCLSFLIFLWTYPFPTYILPLLGMWRWLTMGLTPFTLYDLWVNPWIFLYQWSPIICLISIDSYVPSFIPLSPPPILTIGAIYSSIVMATCQPHLFYICFMIPFSPFYFILLCTVHHRSCVHTCNLSLVLKTAKASKELYSSSFVVSPKKKCK